jgi:hypothetical protein
MTTTSDRRTVLDTTAAAVAQDQSAAVVTFAGDSDLVGVTEVNVPLIGITAARGEAEA